MLDSDQLLLAYRRARTELDPSGFGEDALELSPGGRYFFPPQPDGRGFLLDTETLTRLEQPYRAYVRAVVFQNDTRILLSSDFGVEVFQLPDMAPVVTIMPHLSALKERQEARQSADEIGLCIDFGPIEMHAAAAADGTYVATHFQELVWWDPASGARLGAVPCRYSRAIAISERFLVSAGALKESTVYRLPAGEVCGQLPTAEWLQFCPAQPEWVALRERDQVSVRHVLSGQLLFEHKGCYQCCWWGRRLLLRERSKLLVRSVHENFGQSAE
jgi:hypothetical protein